MHAPAALFPLRPRRRGWFSLAVLAVVILGFGPFALGRAVFGALVLVDAERLLRSGPFAFAWFVATWPPALLFASPARYLLATLIGAGLVVVALRWGRPGRVARPLLVLSLLLILSVPWLARYRPAVVAAPGYDMQWLTAPGALGGVVKQAQAIAELRPCAYTLLGWAADGALYYEEACRGRAPVVWAYHPDRDRRPSPVPAAPDGLAGTHAPVNVIQEWLQVPDLHPPESEHSLLLMLVRDLVVNPAGGQVAAVVRHVYGPEDVVLLAPAD